MRQGQPSEIPGAPPAGVSRPIDPRAGGGYEPLEQSNSSFDEAMEAFEVSDQQQSRGRRQVPWPTKRQQQQVQYEQQPRRAQSERYQQPPPQPQQPRRRPQKQAAQQAAQQPSIPNPPRRAPMPQLPDEGFTESGQHPPMNTVRGKRRLPQQPAQRVPLGNRRRGGSTNPTAELHSADGNTYRFRKMSSGSKNPMDALIDMATASLIAHVEIMKGGDPIDVFEAFGINLRDGEGETYFDWRDADYYRDLSRQIPAAQFSGPQEDDEGDYEGAGGLSAYFEDGDDY